MRIESATRFARIVWEFARKDFRVLRSYRFSFLTGIFAAVYGIVSFRFVSNLVGGTKYIGNSSQYFRFVVVGVVVAGVMRASTITTATNARRDQVEGTLEVLAAQPLPLMTLGLGWAILPALEELSAALITIGIAVPLGFSGVTPNWPATVVALVLTAFVFLTIGFVAAAVVLAVQQGVQVAGVTVALLTLLSGAVFPVAVLPAWLRAVSYVSPLTYALRATRAAILDGGNTGRVATDLLILVGITAVLLPVGLIALRMSLAYARARGSLARF